MNQKEPYNVTSSQVKCSVDSWPLTFVTLKCFKQLASAVSHTASQPFVHFLFKQHCSWHLPIN